MSDGKRHFKTSVRRQTLIRPNKGRKKIWVFLMQVHFAHQLFRVPLARIRFSDINRSLWARSCIVKMTTPKKKRNFMFSSPKGIICNSHFIRTQYQIPTIVEMYTHTPVRQSISHPVSVTMTHPTYDEHSYFK